MASGQGHASYTDSFQHGEISIGDSVAVLVSGSFSRGGKIHYITHYQAYRVVEDGRLKFWNFPPVEPCEAIHDKW
ncbi:MAG: hypothetical protein HY513_04650, partial [Candidatus Aenigmarchaeota archaeon]|nr:hypothetical protein [Candidatus Aenigmarchaeota archaeon]